MKLTKREIDRIELPTKGYRLFWDSDLEGFGLRATPSRLTYVAQGRVNGRSVRVTLGRHGALTPDQARAEARKCLGDIDRGIDRNRIKRTERAAGITLEEAYKAYIASKPLASSTKRDYGRALQVGFGPWKGLPFAKITGGMVNRRFEELSENGPAQANQIFRFLRALLGWAMWRYGKDDGTPLMATNPCQVLTKLKRWNRVERRVRHLEPAQLRPFMEAIAHDPDDGAHLRATKDLCALLVLTGLREQEGCRLQWEDIDLKQRVLTVRHTKNHRQHTLPIGDWLARRLSSRRADVGLSPYIFPAENRSGHLIYHRRHVLAIVKAAGVDFRCHDLRRTFASIVNHHLERSLSAYTIKRLLNHASGSDVTAGYIQHSVESLREPMEMVERFVLGSAGIVPALRPHLLSKPPVEVVLQSVA